MAVASLKLKVINLRLSKAIHFSFLKDNYLISLIKCTFIPQHFIRNDCKVPVNFLLISGKVTESKRNTFLEVTIGTGINKCDAL